MLVRAVMVGLVGVALGACRDPRALDGVRGADARAPAPPDAAPAPVAATCPPCPEPPSPAPDAGGGQRRERATFADLPGWTGDTHADALPPLLASCAVLAQRPDGAPVGYDGKSGTIGQWRGACAEAARVPPGDHAAARAFFEREFRPWAALGAGGAAGKATGYCVQPLRASRRRGGAYQWPLYARPPDLVEVFLSDFIDDGRGRRLWGKVDGDGHLRRFPTRGELRASGALAGHELVWVDDPLDALYAQIEGSARATLDDGSVIWLNFDGKNGRGRKGIAAIVKEAGVLPPGQRSMADIRAWYRANPQRGLELLDGNSSVVFFEISPQAGATGSQGVILTDDRSVAVDRALIAHTTPVWVDTIARGEPWQKLTIAQDTGGAILGAVRVDIYLGHDPDAVDLCGKLNFPARTWLLLPRAVETR